jgi:hypothetical protein
MTARADPFKAADAAWSKPNGAAPPGPCLTLAEWLARDLPPPDFLFGQWLSTTTRALLIAPTGLGKTNFAMAIAVAMGSGRGFLHWACLRKARVLYIDGEMSRRLMRARLADAVRRNGHQPENLFVLCRDDVETMPPLNTAEGQDYIDGIIKRIGGVDFVVFDNIQSLISGDMKEEEGWADVLPWVKQLTRRHIGQLWIHHTGHDESKGYGTKTREWQLDTVTLLERLERPDADIAFTLSFTKARERSPMNRSDFETVAIALAGDEWQGEETTLPDRAKGSKKPPSPLAIKFHAALLDACIATGKPRPESANRPSVTANDWKAECVRLGLIDRDASGGLPKKEQSLFNKYRRELLTFEWIAMNGDHAWSIAPK